MKTKLLCLITGSILMLSPKVFASSAEQCFDSYNELTSTALSAARQQRQMDGLAATMLSQWQQQASNCQGTGIYEARLAQLHILHGDYAKAQAVLTNTQVVGDYRRYLELATLWLEYYQLDVDADPTLLLTRLKTFTAKHADFAEGQALYGFALTMAQQPAEAIVALKKSLTAPTDLYDTYKALTLNYVNLQQYSAANEMVNEAYGMNPAFSSDPEAMLMAIKISIELKDFKTVDNLFKVLNARTPQAMQYEAFQQLYQEYQAAVK